MLRSHWLVAGHASGTLGAVIGSGRLVPSLLFAFSDIGVPSFGDGHGCSPGSSTFTM